MKTLYLDLGMGAAGDMLTAALLELLPDPQSFVGKLNGLGIPGVVFEKEDSIKCGIKGTHMSVKIGGVEENSEDANDHSHEEAGHSHTHNDLKGIRHIVCDHLDLPEVIQRDVLDIYTLIAEAESSVHGVPVSEIHFHEVGNMDAIADITAVCMLIHEIAPDRIVASPVHVGSGHVRCAHGLLPVPAPATAYILKDIPMYGGRIQGELCTPTGAAILRHFVDSFGDMPVMKVDKVGYGMGKKDFEMANCVRVMLGESNDSAGMIVELSCNMDDMTGEKMGYATTQLFLAGALDVYTIPIGMKKNRPGILLRVMCNEPQKETIIKTIFKYTTTIGIREQKMQRYMLDRHMETVDTPLGPIRRKCTEGYGVSRAKWEYDDLKKAATEKGLSLTEVEKIINE